MMKLTFILLLVFISNVLITTANTDVHHSPFVKVLTSSNFDELVSAATVEQQSTATSPHSPYWFVKFYAPWCGHCQRLAPVWNDLGSQLEATNVRVAKVDCTQNGDLCNKYNVRGYPSLFFFKNGEYVAEYEGSRSIAAMQSFAQKMTRVPKFDGSVITLTDSNFERTVTTDIPNANWFIKFHSPNCGHCRAMEPTWIEFAKEMAGTDVMVAQVNVLEEKELANKFKITRYPTLIFVSGRKMVTFTPGTPRTVEAFKKFVTQDWKTLPASDRPILNPSGGSGDFLEQLHVAMQENPLVFYILIGVIILVVVLCVIMILCLMDSYEGEPIKKSFPSKPVPPPRPSSTSVVDDSPLPTSLSATKGASDLRVRPVKDKDY